MNRWALITIIVGSTVASDMLQSWQMKRHGEVTDFRVHRLLATLLGKLPMIASVVFLAISFYALLALLQISDLSFAVPATALSIVVEIILARLVLKEQVTPARWGGVVLVAIGVWLLAL